MGSLTVERALKLSKHVYYCLYISLSWYTSGGRWRGMHVGSMAGDDVAVKTVREHFFNGEFSKILTKISAWQRPILENVRLRNVLLNGYACCFILWARRTNFGRHSELLYITDHVRQIGDFQDQISSIKSSFFTWKFSPDDS